MAAADQPTSLSTEELTAIIREVRDRVRSRYPSPSSTPDVTLADLMPIVHARDAAEAKVAAIGSVNPRRAGPVNWLFQAAKRVIARGLDWHVREQVEFNRNIIDCINASIEALNECNRALVSVASRLGETKDPSQIEDIRSHWAQWRVEWERNLSRNEMHYLRSASDLQSSFQQRAALTESNFRDLVKSQHAEFQSALDRISRETEQKLWADLHNMRAAFEALIHTELRLVRQRAAIQQPSVSPGTVPAPTALPGPPEGASAGAFDYGRFAERFRGSEEYVREKQRFYLPYFAGRRQVLDVGCGRGEFLELMREAGVPARGIDLSSESVELCRQKKLQVERADLFAYLTGLPDRSLDGIFNAQVIEHLPPERIPEMIGLCAAKLGPGGLLAIETPNPECLAIFASHFYLDPTHTRPCPAPLLSFYMEEYGLGIIEVQKLSAAMESMPSLAALPEEFRTAFFGGLDYAIFGRKLA